MELDLLKAQFDLQAIKPIEIEEALEDPFAIRLLPDAQRSNGESRYYLLGCTISSRYLFLCFSTDGKKARIFAARDMSKVEQAYYQRRHADLA